MDNKTVNVPLELAYWCEKMTDNMETYLGSDDVVNGTPCFRTDFERDKRKFTVYIVCGGD